MNKHVGTKKALIVLLSLILMSCSNTKQIQTQATESSNTHSSGHIEDVIRTAGLQEFWVVPTERNGVIDYDTIRHQIDLKDNVRRKSEKKDTVRHQELAEQTKGKVKTKQKGLRETITSVGKDSAVSSVALIISIGINAILIFVFFTVIFLKKYHKV